MSDVGTVDPQVEEHICEVCGKSAASAAGLSAHMRSHETKGAPAILEEWRRAPFMRLGIREIVMLDPRCDICQNEENAGTAWYRRCPHDPYVTVAEVPDPKPVYEDDPENSGRRRVVGMDQGVRYVTIPNTRGITLSKGSMDGLGVVNARRKGFILPSELRSESFPNGIAEACQYRDCKYQRDLKEYAIGNGLRGTFCREEEAQLVWYMETGTTINVGEWNEQARADRARDLRAAQIG